MANRQANSLAGLMFAPLCLLLMLVVGSLLSLVFELDLATLMQVLQEPGAALCHRDVGGHRLAVASAGAADRDTRRVGDGENRLPRERYYRRAAGYSAGDAAADRRHWATAVAGSARAR